MEKGELTPNVMADHEKWRIDLLAKLSTTNYQGTVQNLLTMIDTHYPQGAPWGVNVSVEEAAKTICDFYMISALES